MVSKELNKKLDKYHLLNHPFYKSWNDGKLTREIFNADYVVWVDTIKKGRFDDTNAMFVKPEKFDFRVTSQDAKVWATQIAEKIK